MFQRESRHTLTSLVDTLGALSINVERWVNWTKAYITRLHNSRVIKLQSSLFATSRRLFVCILMYMCITLLTECLCVTVEVPYANVKTEEGRKVILSCKITTSAKDNPQITWFKGQPGIGPIVLKVNTAKNVYISRNFTGRVYLEGQANLVIVAPELSDTGNYSCEALLTVDFPPIHAGYVFLNVTTKTLPLPTRDSVSLGLAIADTVVVTVGILLFFGRRKAVLKACGMYVMYTYLTSSVLCLIGAPVLYIHYTLTIDGIYKDSIKTTGVTFSVLGVILGCVSLLGVIWRGKVKSCRCQEVVYIGLSEREIKRTLKAALDEYEWGKWPKEASQGTHACCYEG